MQGSSIIFEGSGVLPQQLLNQAQQGGAHSLCIRGVIHEASAQQESWLRLRCRLHTKVTTVTALSISTSGACTFLQGSLKTSGRTLENAGEA
jgi:hypothetical protein